MTILDAWFLEPLNREANDSIAYSVGGSIQELKVPYSESPIRVYEATRKTVQNYLNSSPGNIQFNVWRQGRGGKVTKVDPTEAKKDKIRAVRRYADLLKQKPKRRHA